MLLKCFHFQVASLIDSVNMEHKAAKNAQYVWEDISNIPSVSGAPVFSQSTAVVTTKCCKAMDSALVFYGKAYPDGILASFSM